MDLYQKNIAPSIHLTLLWQVSDLGRYWKYVKGIFTTLFLASMEWSQVWGKNQITKSRKRRLLWRKIYWEKRSKIHRIRLRTHEEICEYKAKGCFWAKHDFWRPRAMCSCKVVLFFWRRVPKWYKPQAWQKVYIFILDFKDTNRETEERGIIAGQWIDTLRGVSQENTKIKKKAQVKSTGIEYILEITNIKMSSFMKYQIRKKNRI